MSKTLPKRTFSICEDMLALFNSIIIQTGLQGCYSNLLMDKKSPLFDKWEPKDLKRASKLKQQNPSWRTVVLQDWHSTRQIPKMPPKIQPLGPQILFLSKAKEWWFHNTQEAEAWGRLSDVWCHCPVWPPQQKLWKMDLQKEAWVYIIWINRIYLLH